MPRKNYIKLKVEVELNPATLDHYRQVVMERSEKRLELSREQVATTLVELAMSNFIDQQFFDEDEIVEVFLGDQ